MLTRKANKIDSTPFTNRTISSLNHLRLCFDIYITSLEPMTKSTKMHQDIIHRFVHGLFQCLGFLCIIMREPIASSL